MKKRRPWWHRVLLYGGSALAFYVGACFYLANLYLHPIRSVPSTPPSFREVWIDSTTPAWTTADQLPRTVFIFAHGYGGDRSHWTDLARELKKKGFDSIIPAMPGQDASRLPQVGFGPKEAEVLNAAADFAKANGAEHVVLVGVSMGGAASWLASEKGKVDAVVTEGAYARFSTAMRHWLDAAVPGGSVTLRPVVWIACWRSGIDPELIRPAEAAQAWRGKPALVIQAGNDQLIGMHHAEELSKAAACPLWVVPGAVHANCYWFAKKEYLGRLVALARQVAGTTKDGLLPVNSRN